MFLIIPSVLSLGILSGIVSELEELARNFPQRVFDQKVEIVSVLVLRLSGT